MFNADWGSNGTPIHTRSGRCVARGCAGLRMRQLLNGVLAYNMRRLVQLERMAAGPMQREIQAESVRT
ncbi:MAG: hypothetical protein WBE08_02710 [Methyloceanibacter sp.]|jgi:hypothetical protein